MKQVPGYLFVIIFYFLYDDIWFTYKESPFLHSLLIIIIGCIGLLYAVGQGAILRQLVSIAYEQLLGFLQRGKQKVDELRGKEKKNEKEGKKE